MTRITFAQSVALTISTLAALTFVAPDIQSRPKSIHHECGQEDQERLRNPAAQAGLDACNRKSAEDAANGVPVANQHYVLCLQDGGLSCCQDVGNMGARKCDRIMRTDSSGLGDNPTIGPGKPNVPKLPRDEIFNDGVRP
jgi:hypothetical protein